MGYKRFAKERLKIYFQFYKKKRQNLTIVRRDDRHLVFLLLMKSKNFLFLFEDEKITGTGL